MFSAIVRFVVELAKEVKTFRPSVEKARAKIVTSGSKTRRKRTAVMIATIATVTGSRRTFVRFFFPEATACACGVCAPWVRGGATVSTDIGYPISPGTRVTRKSPCWCARPSADTRRKREGMEQGHGKNHPLPCTTTGAALRQPLHRNASSARALRPLLQRSRNRSG